MSVSGRDLRGYVQDAQRAVREKVTIPSGYRLIWTGQYEHLVRAEERLKLVVPVTLAVILLLLYLNFRSLAKSLIVLLSVPFAAIGAIWYLHYLGYNLSVTVWVGIIALAGVAAETGVVMLVYLDEVYERRVHEGRMTTAKDLRDVIMEGAVQRVRPKMMTVAAIMGGLLPIMWTTGTPDPRIDPRSMITYPDRRSASTSVPKSQTTRMSTPKRMERPPGAIPRTMSSAR
ncbi:MAG TPA: hypothetical protein DEH78_33455 [Solibacterales bacterium]|nr:hypothetical protein [Bryobacterales bacterium]